MAGRRLAAVVALMTAVLGGCAGTPPPVDAVPAAAPPAGAAAVAIVDRGWHTDIALPAAALSRPIAGVARAFPGARYLVFGFGDRVFYMSREETFGQTVAAMFPGPGVILVTGLRASPAEAFGADHVVTLGVTCAELAAITGYLQRALATPPDGLPQRLDDGPYPGSVFYASSESYDLFHDCNRWTLAALGSGGLPAHPAGVIFAGQVMAQARAIAAQHGRSDAAPAMACVRGERAGGD